QMQGDWANSMLRINREQGHMPIWQFVGNETGTMVGISSVPIMADMILKGYVADSLVEEAYQAMRSTMLRDFRDLNHMERLGYVPNSAAECVSKTLEYCLDDWSVAQVARKLGHTDDYDYFSRRSLGYRKLYDPQTRFLRSLNEQGDFLPAEGFRPNFSSRDYTEGNPWQYLWLVPHDVEGLADLLGGWQPFVEKLDSLFTADTYTGEGAVSDIAGMVGQYAHGNEPSHHIAYLYNYAGRPDKTSKILREIVYSQYGTDKDGLAGNEDMGQMSAWYILTAMGFYQVEPCGGRYQFGSPLVSRASFKTQQGKTFTVIAHNNSRENIYINKVKLNDKSYKKTYIDYADIVKGGTLEFFMGK
ncbi:MAG: glycoside hydrolase family 92 protein, partial [Prevotella sp.]|nr:glycoside hydrolase family 92 protein [Prevotella sp.]